MARSRYFQRAGWVVLSSQQNIMFFLTIEWIIEREYHIHRRADIEQRVYADDVSMADDAY